MDVAAAGVEPIPERTVPSIQHQSAFWVVAYDCLLFLYQYSTADCDMPRRFVVARGGPEELPFPGADGEARVPGPPISREMLLGYLTFGRGQLAGRFGNVDTAAPVGPQHPHGGKTLSELYR